MVALMVCVVIITKGDYLHLKSRHAIISKPTSSIAHFWAIGNINQLPP
ncbi:hypothetical protein AAEU23_001798 [Escherichia coli]